MCVEEHERDRLEHLARYVLRAHLALDRLKVLGADLVAIALGSPRPELETMWDHVATFCFSELA